MPSLWIVQAIITATLARTSPLHYITSSLLGNGDDGADAGDLHQNERRGNGVMDIDHPPNNPYPGLDWTTALQHFNGAYDEKFGCLWTDNNNDGSWNVSLM